RGTARAEPDTLSLHDALPIFLLARSTGAPLVLPEQGVARMETAAETWTAGGGKQGSRGDGDNGRRPRLARSRCTAQHPVQADHPSPPKDCYCFGAVPAL